MPIDPSLRVLRHERDLAAALRTDGPWVRPTDEHDDAMSSLLVYLVEAHRSHPPRVSDRAFRTLPQAREDVFAGQPLTDADVREVLSELEALRLVESVGVRSARPRWRATDHGVCSLGAPIAA